MQNPKQIWGRDSEKEGSFSFSKMTMSIAETTRGERDKENTPMYQAGAKWLAAVQPRGKTRSTHVSTRSRVG